MIEIKKAIIKEITSSNARTAEVILEIEHKQKAAINYNSITGRVKVGDTVLVNTTAGTLNLGTGGYHFIIANLNINEKEIRGKGHGMKMKYTPIQSRCLLSEEPESEYHTFFNHPIQLKGKLIYIGELHSMLIPLCAYIKFYSKKKLNIAYIMSDHGALPLPFSKSVSILKEKKLLDITITTGNAFGGDFECVNVYTSIQMALNICQCDIAIISMGPGILGTETRYGFSGLELGLYVNLINNLGGIPLYIPRIGFQDSRSRHQGISHHSIVTLKEIVQYSLPLVLPLMKKEQWSIVYRQLKENKLLEKHHLILIDGSRIEYPLSFFDLHPKTMGKGIEDEPDFFYSIGALGHYGLKHILNN